MKTRSHMSEPKHVRNLKITYQTLRTRFHWSCDLVEGIRVNKNPRNNESGWNINYTITINGVNWVFQLEELKGTADMTPTITKLPPPTDIEPIDIYNTKLLFCVLNILIDIADKNKSYGISLLQISRGLRAQNEQAWEFVEEELQDLKFWSTTINSKNNKLFTEYNLHESILQRN